LKSIFGDLGHCKLIRFISLPPPGHFYFNKTIANPSKLDARQTPPRIANGILWLSFQLGQ